MENTWPNEPMESGGPPCSRNTTALEVSLAIVPCGTLVIAFCLGSTERIWQASCWRREGRVSLVKNQELQKEHLHLNKECANCNLIVSPC